MNNGKICVPVCAETADEMIKNIKQAEEFADVIEVRFDCLRKEELEPLLLARTYPGPANIIVESTKIPIISTFRPKEQGGCRDLSYSKREAFWTSGHETAYCDIEEDLVETTDPPWLWGERICSYHDFRGVPPDLEDIVGRLFDTDVDKVKIAILANDVTDSIPLWKLLKQGRPYGELSPRRMIPIAMGEAGKWTRILGLAHGAFLTYAALDAGDETAPGQITAKDMIEIYRVKELDEETKVYGIIGDPVSGSLSPAMLNPAFAESNINAVYLPLLVKDLDAFIRRMVRAETREIELNF
ncbi:MAG: type I 3-dehydroquinate dehydratase, partial [Acidobacteriota bacterium]